VVPDEATVTVNFRFAPDRDPSQAEDELRVLLAPGIDESSGDKLEVLDAAPGAPPSLDNPHLARLVRATAEPPRAKLGWTDVATFFGLGVPAVNFGPGDPLLAHTPHERVSGAELTSARDLLEAFLTSAG